MTDNTLDPSVSGSEAMRAEFETWAIKRGLNLNFGRPSAHYTYENEETESAWCAYRAARADQARIVKEAVEAENEACAVACIEVATAERAKAPFDLAWCDTAYAANMATVDTSDECAAAIRARLN